MLIHARNNRANFIQIGFETTDSDGALAFLVVVDKNKKKHKNKMSSDMAGSDSSYRPT